MAIPPQAVHDRLVDRAVAEINDQAGIPVSGIAGQGAPAPQGQGLRSARQGRVLGAGINETVSGLLVHGNAEGWLDKRTSVAVTRQRICREDPEKDRRSFLTGQFTLPCGDPRWNDQGNPPNGKCPVICNLLPAIQPGSGGWHMQSLRTQPLFPRDEALAIRLQADYFHGQIDLRGFCAAHPNYPILGTTPLVLEPEKGSYVFIARFGAVVFWNCPGHLVDRIHADLKESPASLEEQARDFLNVVVGAPEDAVEFNEVRLREVTLEKLGIVSLTLAQSVALDHLEGSVTQALARFHPVVGTLSRTGRLLPPHREVLRIVGFAMEVRAAVLDNLTLFDDPPETWESESLAHLDGALYALFDLEERLGAIREKLAYLQDAGATFLGLLDTRKGQRLEWIVILLILIEILLYIGRDLLPSLHRMSG